MFNTDGIQLDQLTNNNAGRLAFLDAMGFLIHRERWEDAYWLVRIHGHDVGTRKASWKRACDWLTDTYEHESDTEAGQRWSVIQGTVWLGHGSQNCF